MNFAVTGDVLLPVDDQRHNLRPDALGPLPRTQHAFAVHPSSGVLVILVGGDEDLPRKPGWVAERR